MARIEQIKEEFNAINARAGELFALTADELGARITTAELEQWAEISLSIAGSGWHAWETSNAFCRISVSLVDAAGSDALMECGTYGLALCGYSYEPGATYFRGIGQLVEDGMLALASPIEAGGRAIHSHFTHASSLITDYFRTAFGLTASNDIASLRDWSDITGEMSALTRAELSAFLAASRGASDIDWRFIRELAAVSVAASLDYMRAYPSLRSWIDPQLRLELQRNVLKFAAGDEPVTAWLDSLREAIAGIPAGDRAQLVALFGEVPRIEMAESLLKGMDRLPLHRPEVVQEWILGVRAYLPLNIEAACGFLSMEAATAVDLMQRLLGQVNFSDCQRILQLYSEAIVGRHLLVDAHGEHMDGFRGLPTTDGLCIYLPESISRYQTVEDNFALYKMSLLHQLGYYEFGTFRFSRGDSLVAFSDYFNTFGDPGLAAAIFQVLEDARIDWALERRYRGAAGELARFKRDALLALPREAASVRQMCLDALLRFSLDDDKAQYPAALEPAISALRREILRLRDAAADVWLTMEVLATCYRIVVRDEASGLLAQEHDEPVQDEKPRPAEVDFRGKLEPDRVRVNLQLAALDEQEVEFSEEGEDTVTLSFMMDPKNVTIEQLKRGDVQEALGMMITDLEGRGIDQEELDEEQKQALEEFRGMLAEQAGPTPDAAFRYDEWDCVIEDYRRRWCTLYEITKLEEHPEFVDATLRELPAVARKVRRQLNNLKPELLRKVKGVIDGEDLDLERAVELMVDKRAGLSPEERIYVERLRKDRDVSALFLLDMSASTDDRIPEPVVDQHAAPGWDKDDFLHDYYGAKADVDTRKRIIDLEKEAVVLMAEALEVLGDSYSVCGFSGYGKDQVDFYLCKDFEEPYNLRAKGRIGGMKPCRSTRMGPAIRHATRRLVATESRIKAMIIISDGYPQDFDYGKDRNSKDYGIKDTTMALSEARQKGVQAFCLTVDPSGHDYLREMCPDNQYMVIQDINQLPDELSKVYRSLTG